MVGVRRELKAQSFLYLVLCLARLLLSVENEGGSIESPEGTGGEYGD